MAPPTTKTVSLSATEFFPSALAASSCSRSARRERPYGEFMIRWATTKITAASTSVTAEYSQRYELEYGLSRSESGCGISDNPAAPPRKRGVFVTIRLAMTDSTSMAIAW